MGDMRVIEVFALEYDDAWRAAGARRQLAPSIASIRAGAPA